MASEVTVFGRAYEASARMHARSFAAIDGVIEDRICSSGNAAGATFRVHSGQTRGFDIDCSARQGWRSVPPMK
jgi:predicted PhzF superfamily epimerase YddE/YHI9